MRFSRRFLLYAASLAVLLAASTAPRAMRPRIAIDLLPLRALVTARDFDGLEARFAAARATGDTHELTALLWALNAAAKGQEAGIDAWDGKRPRSLPARLALAQPELGRAWEARGEG